MCPSSLNAQIFPLRGPRGALAARATRGALRARACYAQQGIDTGGQIPLMKNSPTPRPSPACLPSTSSRPCLAPASPLFRPRSTPQAPLCAPRAPSCPL
eukprot:scaffold21262_cov59-Phaeocystis_antarctica.AAC.3